MEILNNQQPSKTFFSSETHRVIQPHQYYNKFLSEHFNRKKGREKKEQIWRILPSHPAPFNFTELPSRFINELLIFSFYGSNTRRIITFENYKCLVRESNSHYWEELEEYEAIDLFSYKIIKARSLSFVPKHPHHFLTQTQNNTLTFLHQKKIQWKEARRSKIKLFDLGDGCLQEILGFLSGKDRQQVLRVCKRIYQIGMRAIDPCREGLSKSWLELAFLQEKKPVIKMLLSDGRMNPNVLDGRAFDWAVEKGDEQLVLRLIQDPRMILLLSKKGGRLLVEACKKGWTEVFDILLAKGIDPSWSSNEPLRQACNNDQKELVERLLKDKRVCLEFNDNLPLSIAYQRGWLDIIPLLTQKKGWNARAVEYDQLREALKKGYEEIVFVLLEQADANLTTLSNWLLQLACRYGRESIVKKLLTYKEVDPRVENHEAMCLACEFGHLDVVRLLIESGKGKPSGRKNSPIQLAAENGHLEVVKELLKYSELSSYVKGKNFLEKVQSLPSLAKKRMKNWRVDPTADQNMALRKAASNGHAEIVSLLLQYPGMDPTAKDHEALIKACEKGAHEVVRVLMRCPTVDPSFKENLAIKIAMEHGRILVVNELLKCPKVNLLNIDSRTLVKFFKSYQSVDTVRALLRDKRVIPSFDLIQGLLELAQQAQQPQFAVELLEHYGHVFIAENTGKFYPYFPHSSYIWAIYNNYPVLFEKLYQIFGCCNNEKIYLEKIIIMGHIELLKKFLKYVSYPSDVLFDALVKALDQDNVEIVLELLKNPIVQKECKTRSLDLLLKQSSQKKLFPVFQELIQFYRSFTQSNFITLLLMSMEQEELILCLLQKNQFNKQLYISYEAFKKACSEGRSKIVRAFIDHFGPLPLSFYQKGFLKACAMGHLNVVKELLQLVKDITTMHKNLALCIACKNGRVDVARFLLTLSEVNSKTRKEEAYRLALLGDHQDVVELLKQYSIQND